jgi:glycosyltransferase involved in cell wall biosynthesis
VSLEASRPARLSVVMPVRDALPFLDAAIESVLGQTHGDFEFLIGDDGSTDGSTEALRGWAARDARIRLIEHRGGLGPVGSSNWVVREASGALIARMDADDLSHPDRLRRQLEAMAAHPDCALVGTLFEGIDETGRRVREADYWAPLNPDGFAAPFAHGSILFRRDAFERAGGYRPGTDYWEDIDLTVRMAGQGRILILPAPLFSYRFSPTSSRLNADAERVERAIALMLACAERHRAGLDYGALIARGPDPGRARRLPPLVFRALSSQIWAGRRPRLLLRMARRARLPSDRASASDWLYMIWATLSPRSLRWLVRRRFRRRNAAAAPFHAGGQPYERVYARAPAAALPASQGAAAPSAPGSPTPSHAAIETGMSSTRIGAISAPAAMPGPCAISSPSGR